MDFSAHSWHRPKDSSPDCTELMEVVSKGTKDKGMAQEEGRISVCFCEVCVMLLLGGWNCSGVTAASLLCCEQQWVDNLKKFEAGKGYSCRTSQLGQSSGLLLLLVCYSIHCNGRRRSYLKVKGLLSAYHMQNEKMVLDLNCSEMWTPERGHSKQMEGEQGNIERIMIWLGSCSDSTLAASWVLSGLEVSLQRWVSRRDDEADSVVDASDVGRTFTSLVHKGLWTVETADIALGLSQHYHAVRMFIWTNRRKRLSHAYLNIKDSEDFEDRAHHLSWPSGCSRGHGITVIPAPGPSHLGWITAAFSERRASLTESLEGRWCLTFRGPVYVFAQHVKYSKHIFVFFFFFSLNVKWA